MSFPAAAAITLATFAFMEFWAWFMHRVVQHGPLWVLHRSHHVRPSPRPFERNDLNNAFSPEAKPIFYRLVELAVPAGIMDPFAVTLP